LPLVFGQRICHHFVLLIRVNLCNLWMIILKDWIPGQARDDTVYSLVDLFRGNLSTISLFHLQKSC